MTAQPPSSSGGDSLPPRHRPALSTFSRDTTERDLWDFDDESESPKAPEKPPTEVGPRFFGKGFPVLNVPATDDPQKDGETKVSKLPVGRSDQILINVTQKPATSRTAAGQAPFLDRDEMDITEDWEQFPDIPPLEEAPVAGEPLSVAAAPVAPPAPAMAPPPEVLPPPPAPPAAKDVAQDEGQSEFEPVMRTQAAPVVPRPRIGLSVMEWVGLTALLLLLIAGGTAVFLISMRHLPAEVARARANDFPIKGTYLTIDSATSYWREPITAGPSRDTFRRGTKLLPVLEITVRGGPATVRVYFRNEDHGTVGDSVTRSVRAGEHVRFPATAGFDDSGMLAAYRTGENKPWTIEVSEAPADNPEGAAFKKLFEMNIATDYR